MTDKDRIITEAEKRERRNAYTERELAEVAKQWRERYTHKPKGVLGAVIIFLAMMLFLVLFG